MAEPNDIRDEERELAKTPEQGESHSDETPEQGESQQKPSTQLPD